LGVLLLLSMVTDRGLLISTVLSDFPGFPVIVSI